MQSLVALTIVSLVFQAGCHAETAASPDVPSAPTPVAEAEEESPADSPDEEPGAPTAEVPELSLDGIAR